MDHQQQMDRSQEQRNLNVQAAVPSWTLGFRRSLRDRTLWRSSVAGLGVGLVLSLGFLLVFHTTQETVVLHYTTLLGIDRLGRWIELLLYPAALMFMIVINFLIASLIRGPAGFSNTVLAVTNVLVSGLIVFGSILLALANRASFP